MNYSLQPRHDMPLAFRASAQPSFEIEKSPEWMAKLSQTVERVAEMLTPIAKALEKLLQMLSTMNPANQKQNGRPAQQPPASTTDITPAWRRPSESTTNITPVERRPSESTTNTTPTGRPLTPSEQRRLDQLKARDREVRIHEKAHKDVAGDLAPDEPVFDYQIGPDGNKYAVGGKVDIRYTLVKGDYKNNIAILERVRRAALAPVKPSDQDLSVADDAKWRLENERSDEQRMASERGLADMPWRGSMFRRSA